MGWKIEGLNNIGGRAMRELLPPPRAVPLPRRGRSLGWKIEGLNHVGGRAMRAPTTLRKIATVRCVFNAGLHHCNGQMYLQPSIAPSYTVGARIARPFVPDVITTTLREGARRVIGATAKPLYAIDGKAVGLDRRTPQTSLLDGGGPPRGRWKEFSGGGNRIEFPKSKFMRQNAEPCADLRRILTLISYLIRRGQSIPCLFLVGTPAQNEKN